MLTIESLVTQMVKNLPAVQETRVHTLGSKDLLEKQGNPLQSPCLGNSMDRGVWWAKVHGVSKSRAWLSD